MRAIKNNGGFMKTKRVLATLMLAGAAASANATLVGDSVHIAQNFPTIGAEFYPTDAVVGSNVEFTWPAVLTLDIGATAIDIRFATIGFQNVPAGGINHNGPIVWGLNDSLGGPLLGISNFATNSAFSASNIMFGDDYIGFNLDNLAFTSGQFIHVDLNFAAPSAVAEPGSLALFGLGLLGLAFARRVARKAG